MKPRCPRSPARSLSFEPLEVRLALSGSGLTGQYFHNPDFSGLAFERTEAVNRNWGSGAPAAGMDADSFSIRWLGQVEAEYTETYTFSVASDDGARLWVDGRMLVDNWAGGTRIAEGDIALEAGRRYDIRLEYQEVGGAAYAALRWSSASQALEAIPASQLYSLYDLPQGLHGEYSDSFGGHATRIDPTIEFIWRNSPIEGTAADGFEVRWSGMIRPDFSGEYVFRTTSDEGVRLWIGGELVIDNWSAHTTAVDVGVKTLEAGKWYDIRLEHYDQSDSAVIELAWSNANQTDGQFQVIGPEYLRAARYSPVQVTNPLGNGADPFVVQHDGSYLLIRSAGNRIRIDKADRLEDIHADDPASETITAWTAPSGTDYSHNIWAPELHQINGKWYIYVAADDGHNENHRMYVLERNDPDPMGPYVFKGQITDSTDRWAIDGTVLPWEDKLYFVWSGWPGSTNGQQNLYIAEMSNPWTISSPRYPISAPTASWERHGLPINEGPQILINDGQLHIIYSGSGFWTHQYALGRLTYDGSGSLLSAANWDKASGPVFQRSGSIVGVGHASFTKSEDGTESWIVYHAHTSPTDAARQIRIQPFTYTASGAPSFGSPLPNSIRLEAPSGEADSDRPLLPGDHDASGVVNAADLATWEAQFGAETFPGRVVSGADFLNWQRGLGSAASASSIVGSAAAMEAAVVIGREGETAAPVAARLAIAVDVTAGRWPTMSVASGHQADPARLSSRVAIWEEHVDRAFADWRVRRHANDFLHLPEDRLQTSLDDVLWSDPPLADDYRIGAEGAWLMSTGADNSLGASLGASVGESLAIDPASL